MHSYLATTLERKNLIFNEQSQDYKIGGTIEKEIIHVWIRQEKLVMIMKKFAMKVMAPVVWR